MHAAGVDISVSMGGDQDNRPCPGARFVLTCTVPRVDGGRRHNSLTWGVENVDLVTYTVGQDSVGTVTNYPADGSPFRGRTELVRTENEIVSTFTFFSIGGADGHAVVDCYGSTMSGLAIFYIDMHSEFIIGHYKGARNNNRTM